MSYFEWRPYVPVAKRRANAEREMKKLQKKGVAVEPVEIQGRKIARTFWGEAWCDHLEQFSDYDNRLPRGQTYVRNGSVCHLAIKQGKVEAIVSGTELYNISIDIAPLSSAKWKHIRRQCTGQIGSMLELLQGRLSSKVMAIVTEPAKGLFPRPGDIKLHCDCPDWADMCKHVAAALYGVGARLDKQPELLFKLRKVDHEELISAELDMQSATSGQGKRRRLADQDLANLFGIDIDDAAPPVKKKKAAAHKTTVPSRTRKPVKKKTSAQSVKTRTVKARAVRTRAASAGKPFSPTGAAVSRLRKQLGMNRTRFADLIGVSPQTIANWESRRGKLKLQARTLAALAQAALKKHE